MNTKRIALLALFAILLISCKNEKSAEDLKVVESEFIDKSFKVAFEVVAQKEDDFALLYTLDGSINFYTIPAIWQHFKGSNDAQEVSFVIPESDIPTQLRIDLGLKQDQPNIKIKSFKLMYQDKTFEAKGADVFKYFRADENQCKVDIGTGEVIANVKDGKRLTPSLYPIEAELSKQISLLVK